MISLRNNLAAMNGSRMSNINSKRKAKSMEKLSSGFRINRAADDAAGLAISEKMRRQVRGLTMGVENVQDGVSICQVADGALAEVHDMLNRISELSIKAANGTMTESDRMIVQAEVDRLKTEITRIGTSTTFNEIHIFDHANGENITQNVNINLIRSPSASMGYLYEVYKDKDGYHPSASMDFSALRDPSQIRRLDGRSFSFTCSVFCPETFTFTFVDQDGRQSGFLNPESKNQPVEHRYQIDVMGIETGEDLLDRLFNVVKNNPARNDALMPNGGVKVSHSNVLIKTGANTLVLHAARGYSTREEAMEYCVDHRNKNSPYGRAEFAMVANATDEIVKNILPIHYGADAKDRMLLYIEKMNARTLGLNDLSVMGKKECYKAIDKTKEAMVIVNRQRSLIGAQQNRLESTIDNENNVIENLTASESRIRDTDMAQEVMREATLNILEQAGYSLLAQANQNNQSVLAMFSA